MTNQATQPKKLPESHDDYAGVLLEFAGNHRIIMCRNSTQFILQRSSLSKGEKVWRSISFCVTRKALIRDIEYSTNEGAPELLLRLPRRVPQGISLGSPETPQRAVGEAVGVL